MTSSLSPADAGRRTLLTVHAHPDDECIGTGGVLARYAAEGARTVLLTCTDGAVGEISDPALATADNLAEVRSRELDEAARILRVSRLVKLGYRDSGMAGTADNDNPASFSRANFDEAVERVVQVMRAERPQVVVTYDERGGYGHPDHILAVAAFEAAGDARRFPSAGSAWTPAKLYYTVFPRSAILRFGERLREAGIEPPFAGSADDAGVAEEPPFGVPDDRVTTMVDVSPFLQVKRAALESHRTQMGPEQFFMRLPVELFAEAFGRETFQRVVGPGPRPEADLFEGLD
jgi:N-acetyl-1-D-myo-inositol-2-amino-2-deoxy-alpha-D-glucopyranoside deacetylase